MKLANKVKAAHSSSPDFDLTTMSLFGKIWGKSIPFHPIRVKTKRDWILVKGQVDYADMANGRILFKFSNVHDRECVWSNRPWFVSGLNLVLKLWASLFDPYAAKITHVDQWTTITRLPQEYWEGTLLASLLSGVGVFLKAYEYTLSRGKGKFARVCLNVDVTKPLRGTLTVPTSESVLMKDCMKSVPYVVVQPVLLKLVRLS